MKFFNIEMNDMCAEKYKAVAVGDTVNVYNSKTREYQLMVITKVENDSIGPVNQYKGKFIKK